MRILKRVTALLSCGLMLAGMVMSVPAYADDYNIYDEHPVSDVEFWTKYYEDNPEMADRFKFRGGYGRYEYDRFNSKMIKRNGWSGYTDVTEAIDYSVYDENGMPLESANFWPVIPDPPALYFDAIPEDYLYKDWDVRFEEDNSGYRRIVTADHEDDYWRTLAGDKFTSETYSDEDINASWSCGNIHTDPVHFGDKYVSVGFSVGYHYDIRIVSKDFWPIEYIEQTGIVPEDVKTTLEDELRHREAWEYDDPVLTDIYDASTGSSTTNVEVGRQTGKFYETTLAGKRTFLYEKTHMEDSVQPNDEYWHTGLGDDNYYTYKDIRTVGHWIEKDYYVIDDLEGIEGYYYCIHIHTYDRYGEVMDASGGGAVRGEDTQVQSEYGRLQPIVTEELVNELAALKPVASFTPPAVDGKPIEQEDTVIASSDPGEDTGTSIISDIIDGIDKDDVIKGGGAGAAALGAAGLAASGNGKGKKDKKKKNRYKMYVKKDFGDTMEAGQTYRVLARIVQLMDTGEERNCNELTSKIETFSGDGVLTVTDKGMAQGIYKAAEVTIPQNNAASEGMVSFRYIGDGGTFTKNIIFKLEGPKILFGQENLGLPSFYDGVSELWFGVKGLGEPKQGLTLTEASYPYTLTAGFDDKNSPYKVEIFPDEKVPNLWCARITDVQPRPKPGDPEPEDKPGDTKNFRLHITARTQKQSIDGYFDVLRVTMGLALSFEGNGLGCYLKVRPNAPLNVTEDDLEPCVTTGRIQLLRWNDEEQVIERVAVYPEKDVQVTALRVDNDNNSLIGEAEERHQTLVQNLGIKLFSTNQMDEKGTRLVKLTCTKAGLDSPTRIRAQITVKVNFQKETYEVKKKLLLHSQPMRRMDTPEAYEAYIKHDERIAETLYRIKGQIWSKYMKNLSSMYYLIDRMIDGYDENFGYDERQVNRIADTWIRYIRGEFAGANADPIKLTLADELNAVYAFMQGMRDNGGFLGRMALGFATAGYSEMLFFGMDLAEKMEETIVKQGKDMNFWQGIKMGIEEYEKQVAMDLLIGGALKLGNTAVGKATGIDLAKTITNNYRHAMDSADAALKSKSGLYKGISTPLEKIGVFSKNPGAAARAAMDRSAHQNAQAKMNAQTTIAQRRMGDLGLSPEQMRGLEIHDGAMAQGMEKVRRLYDVMKRHGTARAEGKLPEVEAEFAEAWLEVKTDKNAFKALKRMNDPYAQTVKAEFTRYRKLKRQVILDRVLDDVAAKTGKNKKDLYFESITSNDPWKEDAGLSLSEDLDLTIREKVYSETGKDIVIDQSIGDEAVRRQLYKEFHNGAEPPSDLAAKTFAEDMDVTYVAPFIYENDYTIMPNPEAYMDVKPLLDPKHHGDELKAAALDRYTMAHKGKEWVNRGKRLDARAADLETQASRLTGTQRDQLIEQATQLRYKADGCYVEGTRQIVKGANNIVEPRAQVIDALGNGDPYTMKAREMVAAGEMVQEGTAPSQFFDYLQAHHGTDFNGFADEVASCLH